MNASELAQRAIQEAFARALSEDSDADAYDRRDRQLAASLRRIVDHFPDPTALSAAANAPLSPFSPCLPLALACHLFAGARGTDYLHTPDSCKALLDMGADPFAKSPSIAPGDSKLPGRYIFGTEELNAFEIALAKSDGALILAIGPAASPEDFEPHHWSAYELFCDFREPMKSRCDEVMRALAERGFFRNVVQPTSSGRPEDSSKGAGGRRL